MIFTIRLLHNEIEIRSLNLSEATVNASMFFFYSAEVKCAVVASVVCYSLALEVPKAISAKCVGLKRDTLKSRVVFFLSSHTYITVYCKWSSFRNHCLLTV